MDLTCKSDAVRVFERRAVRRRAAAFKQIVVVMTQIDASDRAECAFARHAARKPVRGHADAHAALHDRQQRSPTNDERRKRMRRKHERPPSSMGFDEKPRWSQLANAVSCVRSNKKRVPVIDTRFHCASSAVKRVAST